MDRIAVSMLKRQIHIKKVNLHVPLVICWSFHHLEGGQRVSVTFKSKFKIVKFKEKDKVYNACFKTA